MKNWINNFLNINGKAWRELNTSDEFKTDWYGAITNQLGHIALGAFSASFIIMIWSLVFGEMPKKELFIILTIVLYWFNIEVSLQKSRGWDSVIDTYFVGLGVTALIYPFSEKYHPDIGYYLTLNTTEIFMLAAATFSSLYMYAWPRMKRQYGKDS